MSSTSKKIFSPFDLIITTLCISKAMHNVVVTNINNYYLRPYDSMERISK